MLDQDHEIDGITVRAVELTGRPGDVVVVHLSTFHGIAPNVGTKPRLMLGKVINAAC